jgi:DNA-binding LytR/AlgR family response regulator
LCSGTLVEASSLLSSTDFYRSHRSFIVNLRYTVGIERYQFRMINGDAVAVAKNRYAEVKAAFEAYAGVKKRDLPCDGNDNGSVAAIKADT